jgi:hypothetical protein
VIVKALSDRGVAQTESSQFFARQADFTLADECSVTVTDEVNDLAA